jgi:hypothetical protein
VVVFHQDHAVRVLDRFHEVRFGLGLDAELLEVEGEVPLVEDSEHDLLAEQRGKGRHAVVDDLLPVLQLDASVLRHATLGDVQLRHDLEARDQRGLELHRRLHDFHQRAVDAVAHADVVLEALEVDVRRAALDRIREDGVDQLDDGRVLHLRLERGGGDFLVGVLEDLDVAFLIHVLDHVHQVGDLTVHRRFVDLVDGALDRELSPDDGEDVVPRDELEILEHAEVRRVGHRDGERASIPLEREDEVLHREIGGDELGDAGVDLEPGEVDRGHLELAREDLRELGLLNEAELDEVVADAGAALLLLLDCLIELLARDELLAHEEIAESFGSGDRSGHEGGSAGWRIGAPVERIGRPGETRTSPDAREC